MRPHAGLLLLQDNGPHGRCGFFHANATAEHAAAGRTHVVRERLGTVGGVRTVSVIAAAAVRMTGAPRFLDFDAVRYVNKLGKLVFFTRQARLLP